MTVYAGFSGRNSRVAGFLNRGVTVLALKPQSHDVVLVAKRNRLFRALPLLRNPWRTLQLIQRNSQGYDDQPCQDEARAGKRVGTPVKNLRH
jgi:hypothetical protein